MKQEKYFCDKCRVEITNKRDTCLGIRIDLQYPEKYYTRYSAEKSRRLELCYPCCAKIGIKPIKEGEEKQEAPNINDRLYDILCDLGVMFEQ